MRTQFLEKDPWNFQICHFTLGNLGQNEASPLENPQNCVTPIGILNKAKSQNPWKFHMISFGLLQKIPLLFLLTPGISSFYMFSEGTLINSMSSTSPVSIFFGIAPYLPSFLLKLSLANWKYSTPHPGCFISKIKKPLVQTRNILEEVAQLQLANKKHQIVQCIDREKQ